jgi:hypothetical protein
VETCLPGARLAAYWLHLGWSPAEIVTRLQAESGLDEGSTLAALEQAEDWISASIEPLTRRGSRTSR